MSDEEISNLEQAAQPRMHPALLTAYVLLLAWCVGAFAWIGREMVIQHRIFDGIEMLRTAPDEEAEQRILADVENAPLYIVQELQQEPDRNAKVRLSSVLDKAIGRSAKPLDSGNVFSALSNEITTLSDLLDSGIAGIETPWLTDDLRNRLHGFQRTGLVVMTSEEQEAIIAAASTAAKEFNPEIEDQLTYFIETRWVNLSNERVHRIAEFMDSFLRIHYLEADSEEKEEFIELTMKNIASNGNELLPVEKTWLGEKTEVFLMGMLPDASWKSNVVRLGRAYAEAGWVALTAEESTLFDQASKLRDEYDEQRSRFAASLVKSVENITANDLDVPRTLITEMVSLLNSPNTVISQHVSDSILLLAKHRIAKLSEAVTAFTKSNASASVEDARLDESVTIRNVKVQDVIVLLRKTLHREHVPSVMAVKTRTKSKAERQKELQRLLRLARVACASTLGRLGHAAREHAKSLDDTSAAILDNLVTEEVRSALSAILGANSPNVVSAAQAALKQLDSPGA